MLTPNELMKLYLDYANNFLTVTKFAEYYNISEKNAAFILELGRKYYINQ